MGCAITDLLDSKEIRLEDLNGKVLAVDTYNQLYMFLATIRQRDGSLLMDSKGNTTSHLSGLFFRFSKLMQAGLRFVFVFDGKVPKLKEKERERRKALKLEAEKEYKKAAAKEDVEAMKKFAARTSKLTPELLEEAIKLIKAFGMPIIIAPAEGEAQAAHLVEKGQAYAVMSQDADSLLFGSPRIVKNLSITRRKKQASKLSYQTINPVLIGLHDNLKTLKIDKEQLIVIGMLVGTDYNIGGIKGIGPKNAIKLVNKYDHDFDSLFKEAKWDDYFNYSWKDVFSLFKDFKVTEDYVLDWNPVDEKAIINLLVNEHEFGINRVQDVLKNLREHTQSSLQKGLGDWI